MARGGREKQKVSETSSRPTKAHETSCHQMLPAKGLSTREIDFIFLHFHLISDISVKNDISLRKNWTLVAFDRSKSMAPEIFLKAFNFFFNAACWSNKFSLLFWKFILPSMVQALHGYIMLAMHHYLLFVDFDYLPMS